MANTWYAKGRQHFSQGDINFPSDNIKAALVTSAYTPDFTNDEFLSTISGIGGAILKRSANLTGKTNTGGILNASSFTFSLVAAGSVGKYIILYKDTGSDASSELIASYDTGNNMPVTTDGGDVVAQIGPGPNFLGQL